MKTGNKIKNGTVYKVNDVERMSIQSTWAIGRIFNGDLVMCVKDGKQREYVLIEELERVNEYVRVRVVSASFLAEVSEDPVMVFPQEMVASMSKGCPAIAYGIKTLK